MFRVSPWIQYDPNGETTQDHHHTRTDNIRFRSMNEDVEMDAPQISTLRDDETPPPQPAHRTGKFRVKLVMGEGKRAESSAGASQRKEGESDDEDEDEDDEEDQLIDDDDEEGRMHAPAAFVSAPAPATEKRGTGVKRGTGTGRGRGRGRGAKAKIAGRVGVYTAFTITPFCSICVCRGHFNYNAGDKY